MDLAQQRMPTPPMQSRSRPSSRSALAASGAQTARVSRPSSRSGMVPAQQQSQYQDMYYQRTCGNYPKQVMTSRGPFRPQPQYKHVVNRVNTPSYVLRSLPGYAGHIPGKQFLQGGTTYRGETEVLDYDGMCYQPLAPTEGPVPPSGARFVKSTIVPGYAGHVPQQRFTSGNFRVPGFQRQYKGEVQNESVLYAPSYLQPNPFGGPTR